MALPQVVCAACAISLAHLRLSVQQPPLHKRLRMSKERLVVEIAWYLVDVLDGRIEESSELVERQVPALDAEGLEREVGERIVSNHVGDEAWTKVSSRLGEEAGWLTSDVVRVSDGHLSVTLEAVKDVDLLVHVVADERQGEVMKGAGLGSS